MAGGPLGHPNGPYQRRPSTLILGVEAPFVVATVTRRPGDEPAWAQVPAGDLETAVTIAIDERRGWADDGAYRCTTVHDVARGVLAYATDSLAGMPRPGVEVRPVLCPGCGAWRGDSHTRAASRRCACRAGAAKAAAHD